ncbi:hypothetical protein H2201_004825 [Coniosporium apollinis]|uniref:Rhodopsin domain-containing protein n=1 Tax=Coniosporium apollinis TaxID=61459 RepID=A0ABQ9NV81_9PEZI|nr:hypothetical protein H2201_004825 [Coniosporium apollinis]
MASTNGNYESRGPVVFAVTTAMIVLASIFVFLRVVSRAGIVRRFKLDDYFMVLAWLLAFGISFSVCYGVSVGLGRHESDIPPEWDPPLKRAEYAFSVLYNPTLMVTKTSILVFYLTLSKEEKVFRMFTWLTLVVVNVAGLALTFLNVLQCRPVGAAFLNPAPDSAQCIDIVAIYLSSAPVNIITDLAIVFLPMPILTGMRLPKKQKAILVITFGFGIFVAVVDVVRIAYLQDASRARLSAVQGNTDNSSNPDRDPGVTDFSWDASLSFMWSIVEVNVGIMCACVPALKPLVVRFLPRILKDNNSGDGNLASAGGTMNSVDMAAAHRVPTAPASQPNRPPPSAAQGPQKDEPMSFLDFLTSPEDNPEKSNDDGPMGMMDFLTTPDMDSSSPPVQRIQTAMTNTTRHTEPASQQTFFDFVNMQQKKSMVHMTHRESVFPIAMVTILFFIWGFAYGLLDTLNGRFQAVANMTIAQSIGIHSAYFGGYLVSPLTCGRWVLKNWGFKACYMVGLVIYACGTLIFWPSAVLTSFGAFLASNFIVGFGLSILEIAANPFIALCGPPKYMEARLNLSQGIQAVGSICSPLLARKVLFPSSSSSDSLIDVQWTYLGIALFTILLALVFYYVPLPEATDDELEHAAQRADGANRAEIRGVQLIWITLALGVFSQFCYVGAQEVVSTTFVEYLRILAPYLNASDFQVVGSSAFAVGRFVAVLLNIFIRPRYLMLFFFLGALSFSIAAQHVSSDTAVATAIMLYFFEGPLFPFIFAQTLRGLGRHTKTGSAFLTAAISGGAVFVPIMHGVAVDRDQVYAYCVVIAAYAFGILFPLYVNAVPKARRQVDPPPGSGSSGGSGDDSPPSSSSGRASRMSKAFAGLAKRNKRSEESDLPTTEHKERTASVSLS